MPNSEGQLPASDSHNIGQGEREGRRATSTDIESKGGDDNTNMPNLCKPSISCCKYEVRIHFVAVCINYNKLAKAEITVENTGKKY